MVQATDIFYEIFTDLPRQGPGSNETTRQAYAHLTNLPSHPVILDMGCGTGMQTMELARLSHGLVVAVDNYLPFLGKLHHRATQQHMEKHIIPMQGSMASPAFKPGTFDIIWAEGSIYNIGLEYGLTLWKPLLKTHGSIAFSELSWLDPEPPEPLYQYWSSSYPGMHTIDGNLQRIEQAGYTCCEHFVLPEKDWWESFYTPMQHTLAQLSEKYAAYPEAQNVIQEAYHEIALYRTYATYHGYVFYIVQQICS